MTTLNLSSGISVPISEILDTNIVYLKLYFLLYADDTVILASSAKDLQNHWII